VINFHTNEEIVLLYNKPNRNEVAQKEDFDHLVSIVDTKVKTKK